MIVSVFCRVSGFKWANTGQMIFIKRLARNFIDPI